jgi:hypothetical protein
MNWIIAIRDYLTRNITGTAAVVQSALVLAVVFGAKVTPEQVAAIMGFTGTLLTFIAHRTETPANVAAGKIVASQRTHITIPPKGDS